MCLTKSLLVKLSKKRVSPVNLAFTMYPSLCWSNPVVLMPAMTATRHEFDNMAKHIKERTNRTVIAVDARNHYDSEHSQIQTYEHMAQDLVQLMDKLGLERASLLGHSMGGRTAMHLALTRPEIVSSLVICDVSPYSTIPFIFTVKRILETIQSIEFPNGMSLEKARAFVGEKISYLEEPIRQFYMNLLVLDGKSNLKWTCNIDSIINNCEVLASFPRDSLNNKYYGPTLFIRGEKSAHLSDSIEGLKMNFPNANMITIEGAGHWVLFDKAKEFNKIVSKFLTYM